mmetsp:Transcript_102576/g.313674  ORF Transcript_102576/g.313674 Transcript_102576/m.313674 type:complete len:406 (+) Transcript_102576:236-1453(+)
MVRDPHEAELGLEHAEEASLHEFLERLQFVPPLLNATLDDLPVADQLLARGRVDVVVGAAEAIGRGHLEAHEVGPQDGEGPVELAESHADDDADEEEDHRYPRLVVLGQKEHHVADVARDEHRHACRAQDDGPAMHANVLRAEIGAMFHHVRVNVRGQLEHAPQSSGVRGVPKDEHVRRALKENPNGLDAPPFQPLVRLADAHLVQEHGAVRAPEDERGGEGQDPRDERPDRVPVVRDLVHQLQLAGVGHGGQDLRRRKREAEHRGARAEHSGRAAVVHHHEEHDLPPRRRPPTVGPEPIDLLDLKALREGDGGLHVGRRACPAAADDRRPHQRARPGQRDCGFRRPQQTWRPKLERAHLLHGVPLAAPERKRGERPCPTLPARLLRPRTRGHLDLVDLAQAAGQ